MTYKLKAYNIFDGALNHAHSLTHSLNKCRHDGITMTSQVRTRNDVMYYAGAWHDATSREDDVVSDVIIILLLFMR